MMNRAQVKLKITAVAFSAVVFLQSSQGFSASAGCGDTVKNLDLRESPLLDSKSIDQKIQNLSELKLSLDLAKVNGASAVEVGAMDANYKNKERSLVDYLAERKIMTRAQLIEKMKRQIESLQRKDSIDQENRSKVAEEEVSRKKDQARLIRHSVIDGNYAIFHEVAPGDFMMGESGYQVSVRLTQMPDVMATSMTQIIYKKIAQLANERFPKKYKINIDPSNFKGDTRPVEQVSYKDVKEWTKALNDLSDIDEPELKNLMVGHKKGMRYSGFMTDAQREYLMKRAITEDGESIDAIIERDDCVKLEEYSVFKKTQVQGTALVADKKPLFIDGKPFYGLNGNVWEWVVDATETWKAQPKGGVDPVSWWTPLKDHRHVRGGAWNNTSPLFMHTAQRKFFKPAARSALVGFRLVRTVPSPWAHLRLYP